MTETKLDVLTIELEFDKIIYPENIKKYSGGVHPVKNKFRAKIRLKNYKFSEYFDTYEEAFDKLKNINIKKKLPIKNLIYPQYKNEKLDHYEILLTKDKRTKIDIEDLEKVDKYNWFYDGGYALTNLNGKLRLHNYIKDHIPTDEKTIDHINTDRLDNRKLNLRIANNREQSINRKIRSNNTSGVTGVHLDKNNNWISRYHDEKGIRQQKSFSVNLYGYEEAKQMAIDLRLEMEYKLPHYFNALEPIIEFEED